VKGPVSDPSGALKDYKNLYKVQLLRTDLAKYGCQHVILLLSKFVQEVGNSEGKVHPARTLYGIICGIRRHLEENVGTELVACVLALYGTRSGPSPTPTQSHRERACWQANWQCR